MTDFRDPPRVDDDGRPAPEVGSWALEKYRRVWYYDQIFSTGMKDQWDQRVYGDLFAYEPFAERIWELRSDLTAYDAWYVAVAEALAGPLVTLGARLARSDGPRCAFEMAPG